MINNKYDFLYSIQIVISLKNYYTLGRVLIILKTLLIVGVQ